MIRKSRRADGVICRSIVTRQAMESQTASAALPEKITQVGRAPPYSQKEPPKISSHAPQKKYPKSDILRHPQKAPPKSAVQPHSPKRTPKSGTLCRTPPRDHRGQAYTAAIPKETAKVRDTPPHFQIDDRSQTHYAAHYRGDTPRSGTLRYTADPPVFNKKANKNHLRNCFRRWFSTYVDNLCVGSCQPRKTEAQGRLSSANRRPQRQCRPRKAAVSGSFGNGKRP